MFPSKSAWLSFAEASDANRVFEKAMMSSYGMYCLYVIGRIMQFYFDLPHEARTPEVSIFCGIVITAVTGFSAPIFSTYNNAKRQWPSASTTTVVATTTQT